MIYYHQFFGSVKDWSSFSKLKSLKAICFQMVRSLESVEFIRDLKELQFVLLDSSSKIKRLPDLSPLKKLRRIQLDQMKGLESLDELTTAPNLEEVVIIDCNHLTPKHFEALAKYPKLKRLLPAVASIGSKKDKEIVGMFEGKIMEGFYGTDNCKFALK